MYVCICNNVTDKEIRRCVENGACSMEHLADELNVASCCGKCKNCARKVMREAMKDMSAIQSSVNVTLTPSYSQA